MSSAYDANHDASGRQRSGLVMEFARRHDRRLAEQRLRTCPKCVHPGLVVPSECLLGFCSGRIQPGERRIPHDVVGRCQVVRPAHSIATCPAMAAVRPALRGR